MRNNDKIIENVYEIEKDKKNRNNTTGSIENLSILRSSNSDIAITLLFDAFNQVSLIM